MARAAAPDARRPRAWPPHGFHRLSAIPARQKWRTLAAGPSSPTAPPELVLGANRLSVLEFAERDASGSALRHDTISMVGLAQRQAPWLSDGRKHPIARSVHAVRQASSPSPPRLKPPTIPPSRRRREPSSRLLQATSIALSSHQTQSGGVHEPAPANSARAGRPAPRRRAPIVFQLGLVARPPGPRPMDSPKSSQPR
jgi:hypothetical protein